MKKSMFYWLLALFLMAGCSSESTETTEENVETSVDSTGTLPAIPPQNAEAEKKRVEDSIAYEAKRKMLPATKTVEKPWMRILREYKLVFCRVTKGTATEREKDRYNKLNGEISAYKNKLTGAEHVQFLAEYARASDVNNCR